MDNKGFSHWLAQMRLSIRAGKSMNVPCGRCTACCRSSYFIHIGRSETKTISHIPKELLFPAPGRPKGSYVLGYDRQGRCPMLIKDKCSIYNHRPLTCRIYDCRIFAATCIPAGGKDKNLVTQRTRRWKFSYPAKLDLVEHSAVKAAASFLQENSGSLPSALRAGSNTTLAVLAIKIFNVFLQPEAGPHTKKTKSSKTGIIKNLLSAKRSFEGGQLNRNILNLFE